MHFLHNKPKILIIVLFATLKLILLLIADFHSGFDGDEVLYIDTGNHLAFGFMEAPPLISILAYLQNLLHSQSVFINHISVHIASISIIALVGLIILKLDGSWKALLVALVSTVFAPAFGITHNSFQPVIFDQFFWLLGFYFLVSYCLQPDNKYLIYIAIAVSLGFLTKYTIVFFIIGLLVSVVIFRFSILKNKVFWISVLLFILIILPNLYWQFINDFPVIDHLSALNKLMASETFATNLNQFVLTLNPIVFPIWFAGIFIVPFLKMFNKIRLVNFTVLFSLLILSIAGGRFYYFFPLALIGICIGSIYLVDVLVLKKWILMSYLGVLFISSIALIPLALPITDIDTYVKLLKLKEKDDGRIPLIFEARYTKFDWPNLVMEVNKAFQSLSPEEKTSCLILGSDYTQPGVINLFRQEYELPEAFSYHGSYYSWIPEFQKGITVIAVCNTHLPNEYSKWIDIYEPFFSTVELKSTLFCRYARDDRNASFHILICRDFKVNSSEYKQIFKDRIFE